ncbi:MAG: ATP-binding protein [Halochromatium sp.]|uniref:ATP-binding protein n=1 Tax=Halochromatium sp. TaxID=2049430 RepID=UPI00397BC6CA
MSLKPWREIARPHKDVLHGTFKQSEFAADISQVANGTAPPEYQDAEAFFARTFITEGMRLLLISVAQRLAGQGGDPVIQLQTAFGGGKTHTMLAVYHLASRQVGTDVLTGIPPILDEAGITSLPKARVAVLDGIALAPSQELVKTGGQKVTTLWGELAWQLLGDAGLALVRDADAEGTSPGKERLIQLLTQAAPCVILIDELVAFLRQFEPGQRYRAGTFDANLSFIQALTEAMKAVPNAILLASLPESDLEIGGSMGQRTLSALEKYFGRVESVWKPVASEEAFEIVRRRLFEDAGERTEVEGIARQFSNFYQEHSSKLPLETQSNAYYERLCAAYPIHPEVFDRLYEDWSTLDKFQRTRGVLQYMAIVIHRLWTADNRDALILPGSIALDDANVRNKSIHYLPQGWEPVIEREVDGPRSEADELDRYDTRFGSVQAARRVMRTLFLGSAPAVSAQSVRGLKTERILLGAAQPGQSLGLFEDVLKRLRDRLHYLYSDQDRFWLDTKPNLRREMESRMQQISNKDALIPLLRDKVRAVFGQQHGFAGIHVFTPSADVPDDFGNGPRLVVLAPDAGYSRADGALARTAAEQILTQRGEQPRQKRNRLLFLAPDDDSVNRLKETGRAFIAWQGIVADIDEGTLNLDLFQAKLAKQHRDETEKTLKQLVRDTYKWLLCPVEEFIKGRPRLNWDAVSLSTHAPNLISEIERALKDEDWLITEWSPIHLKRLLETWYFKDGITEIGALKVYQDCCHYLYLPRLINAEVFKDAIAKGVASEDYFGFAAGKDGERYLGLMIGDKGVIELSEEAWLIEREAALASRKILKQAQTKSAGGSGDGAAEDRTGGDTGGLGGRGARERKAGGSGETGAGGNGGGSGHTGTSDTPIKTQFYGSIELDPVKAKLDFAQIVDEIIEQFTARVGVEVTLSIDIQAKTKTGFDESLQRTIKENCNVLKFGSAEFEEE